MSDNIMVENFEFNAQTGTERIQEITNDIICSMSSWNWFEIFWFFLLPIAICIIGFVALMNKDYITNLIESWYIKRGYIKIFIMSNSKRLHTSIKKLDKYKRFKIGKKSFSLEEMENYIFAYDKKNVPIFLYHEDFVLPFTIDEKEITEEIKKAYNLTDNDKDKISAVKMRIDSSILGMIYDKKLLSDLYDTTVSDAFKEKMVWVVLGALGLVIAYYTGMIDQLIGILKGL